MRHCAFPEVAKGEDTLPTPQHRICRLAEETAATREPEGALARLRELQEELLAFERSCVAQALRNGSSFGSVAKALGISRQAAHRRYRDLAPEHNESKPLALSSQARHAIRLAREEAAAAGAHGVASDHMLLGVLRSGGAASVALEAGGVTADAARRCVRANAERSGADAPNGAAARAVLAAAADIARARHSSYVDADHLVLAALNGPDERARTAITALGVTPAALRERLGC